jgi:hypothetical protein
MGEHLVGRALARRSFPHHFATKTLRMNNGSFGAAPSEVLASAASYREAWAERPDDVWNKELGPGMAAAAKVVALEVGDRREER